METQTEGRLVARKADTGGRKPRHVHAGRRIIRGSQTGDIQEGEATMVVEGGRPFDKVQDARQPVCPCVFGGAYVYFRKLPPS